MARACPQMASAGISHHGSTAGPGRSGFAGRRRPGGQRADAARHERHARLARARRPPRQRHGIIGMRERVSLLGGEFSAGPLPGYGFQVSAHIPLPPARPSVSGHAG